MLKCRRGAPGRWKFDITFLRKKIDFRAEAPKWAGSSGPRFWNILTAVATTSIAFLLGPVFGAFYRGANLLFAFLAFLRRGRKSLLANPRKISLGATRQMSLEIRTLLKNLAKKRRQSSRPLFRRTLGKTLLKDGIPILPPEEKRGSAKKGGKLVQECWGAKRQKGGEFGIPSSIFNLL